MSGERRRLLYCLVRAGLLLPRKLARRWRNISGLPRGRVTLGMGSWAVDVAMTRGDRYVGLGARDSIEAGTGMLFLYPFSDEREFTMRGCHMPLDIAFLDSRRKVVAMFTMEVEEDRSGYRQYIARAQYMLEVPAGELARAGIAVGDTASFMGEVPGAWLADP